VAPEGTERRLAAVLMPDVVGYARLMAEDEDATVRTVTAYREEVELLVSLKGFRDTSGSYPNGLSNLVQDFY